MSRSATYCQHLGLEKYLQSLKLAWKCSMDKYLEHARQTMDMLNVNMDMQSVRWGCPDKTCGDKTSVGTKRPETKHPETKQPET
jgi:hypothetical protein